MPPAPRSGITPAMEGFVAFPLGFALLQASTYLWHERRHRKAWVRDVPYVRTETDLETGYRGRAHDRTQTYVGPVQHPRAPLSIRVTALWSIGMGQMLIPGGAVALFGTIIYGIGLVGVPGCILAAQIWAVGPALLRAEPGAVGRARAAARFARILNALVLVAVAVALTIPDALGVAVGTAVYAAISLAHARALEHAADRIEELWRSRGYAAGTLATLPARRRAEVGAWA